MFDTKRSNCDAQVPAAPARAHVVQLLDAGYTAAVIARAAGVETRRVRTLLADRTEPSDTRRDGRREHRIYRRLADALLAVPIPDGMFINAVGPVRRLRALVRIGYPLDLLADVLGYDEPLLTDLALGRPDIIDGHLADEIGEVFDRWHVIPGPSGEAREFGRRHRFAAPLAWAVDDEDPDAGHIDDPAAQPVGLTPSDDRVWRRVPPDFADIIADHRDIGHFDEEIAAAMGISDNALSKRLQRARLPEFRRGGGECRATGPIYGARTSSVRVVVGVAS